MVNGEVEKGNYFLLVRQDKVRLDHNYNKRLFRK